MLIIIVALAALGVITALIMIFAPNGKNEEDTPIVTPNEECCGAHEICEVDLKKLSEEIIYYQDEELDQFRNIEENQYSDEAIEQFREVLYTLKKEEINDWLHSLDLRKIALPEILKPEVVMLLVD